MNIYLHVTRRQLEVLGQTLKGVRGSVLAKQYDVTGTSVYQSRDKALSKVLNPQHPIIIFWKDNFGGRVVHAIKLKKTTKKIEYVLIKESDENS